MIKDFIRKKVLMNAISLEEELGIADLAWTKADIIQLINSLMHDDDIIIIGGDVYKVESETIIPLSDNWECEPINNETLDAFSKRSKIEALDYIDKYPISPNENILFSLVFNEQIVF